MADLKDWAQRQKKMGCKPGLGGKSSKHEAGESPEREKEEHKGDNPEEGADESAADRLGDTLHELRAHVADLDPLAERFALSEEEPEDDAKAEVAEAVGAIGEDVVSGLKEKMADYSFEECKEVADALAETTGEGDGEGEQDEGGGGSDDEDENTGEGEAGGVTDSDNMAGLLFWAARVL
jgi:hypothetical protein